MIFDSIGPLEQSAIQSRLADGALLVPVVGQRAFENDFETKIAALSRNFKEPGKFPEIDFGRNKASSSRKAHREPRRAGAEIVFRRNLPDVPHFRPRGVQCRKRFRRCLERRLERSEEQE
ncbi:hypothetical protein AB4Y45_13495 [Paraburkholderia sp. EG287A]|uniref:hypothetical protein n=1 Tax=unclassified Paraburkholderia TaxID=2615204 RepID=UPI0034D2ED06